MNNPDIIYYILDFLPTVDVMCISRVNQMYCNISKYYIFKLYKVRNLPIPSNSKDILFDLSLIDNNLNIIKRFGYDHPSYGLERSALFNSRCGVEYFLSKGISYVSPGIEGAARGNHKELIEFLILKSYDLMYNIKNSSNDCDYGLIGAAKGGHMELIQYFISRGSDNWNWGLEGAAEGGYFNLVEYFILKGAHNWDLGLNGAAKGGHEILVKYFISKGAKHYYGAIRAAAEGGHLSLVEYILDVDNTNYYYLLELAFTSAAQGGHQKIIDYIIDKVKDNPFGTVTWDVAIQWANRHYHIDLANYLKLLKFQYTHPYIYKMINIFRKIINITNGYI